MDKLKQFLLTDFGQQFWPMENAISTPLTPLKAKMNLKIGNYDYLKIFNHYI